MPCACNAQLTQIYLRIFQTFPSRPCIESFYYFINIVIEAFGVRYELDFECECVSVSFRKQIEIRTHLLTRSGTTPNHATMPRENGTKREKRLEENEGNENRLPPPPPPPPPLLLVMLLPPPVQHQATRNQIGSDGILKSTLWYHYNVLKFNVLLNSWMYYNNLIDVVSGRKSVASRERKEISSSLRLFLHFVRTL